MGNQTRLPGKLRITFGRIWTIAALLILLGFALLPAEMYALGQDKTWATTSLDPSEPLSSPSLPAAEPFLFWRLLATGVAGLLITAAHLAHNFRRFLGLGVFTNVYSLVLLSLGAGVSGFPLTSESTRIGHYLSSTLSPWTLNFLGLLVTLIIPAIGRKSKLARSTLLDFEGTATSNPLLAPIVDGISESVRKRMKAQLISDCSYSWAEIKRAACSVLEEEATFQRLTETQRDAAIKWIDSLKASADPSVDRDNKYNALVRLLSWCPFSRLHGALVEARKKAHALTPKGNGK